MTALDRTDPADLAQRCAQMRRLHGDDAVVIANAAVWEQVALDAVELRNLRRLLARLPDDDWQPFDWAVLSLAQSAAREALAASTTKEMTT